MSSTGAEDDTKKKTFRRILVRFAEKTSMVGVGYINSARRTTAKVVWVILLLIALGVMTAHLYLLISTFVKFQKKTKLELSFSNLQLPAVTICNTNVFKLSQKQNTPQRMIQFLNQINPRNFLSGESEDEDKRKRKRKKRFVNDFDKLNFSEYDNDIYEYYENQLSQEYDYDDFQGATDTILEMNERFRDLYVEMDRHQRIEIGHDLHEMLLRCSFNGKTCHADNFTLFQTTRYGNCYTIDSPKLTIKRPGPDNGLSMTLFLQTHEYLPAITDGYGARLQIHTPNTIPFPYESGMYLQAAQETSIALRKKEIKRIGQPHGTCSENPDFFRYFGRKYNQLACQNLCYVTQIIKDCNCFDDQYEELFRKSKLKFNFCETRKEIKCMVEKYNLITNKKLTCNCPQPCKETLYSSTITSRDWPTDDFALLLKEAICENFPQGYCANVSRLDSRSLSKNFLKVDIYYEELNFEELEEEPDIENSQFASDVGGAIGLWIGLSMLSLFEVVQLVGEIIEYFLWKCRTTGETAEKQPESSDMEKKIPTHDRSRENSVYKNPYNELPFQNSGFQGDRGHVYDMPHSSNNSEYSAYTNPNRTHGNDYNSDISSYKFYRGHR